MGPFIHTQHYLATMKLIIIGFVLFGLINVFKCEWVKEMENAGMFQGDILLRPDEDDRNGNQFASIKGGRWPNGKVPYIIDSALGSFARAGIKAAIADYHNYTCLRFHERTNEQSYVRFFLGGGCYSPVGYRPGRVNWVSIGNGCGWKGIVIHEIGHTIGIYHEQSRPDRDNHVKIKWENIPTGLQYNFDKYTTLINSLGTPYDFKSIMHYGAYAFSNNGQRTIETKDPSMQKYIGNRKGFSEIDIKQINLMYCNGVKPSNIPIVTKPIPEVTTSPPRPDCKDDRKTSWCVSMIKRCTGYTPGWTNYMKTYCARTCNAC